MAYGDNPLKCILAFIAIASSMVAFGVSDQFVTIQAEWLNEWLNWAFVLSVVGAFVVSEREAGMMENWEVFSLAAPIVALLAVRMDIPVVTSVVSDLMTEFDPYFGWGLVVLTLLSVWVLER